MNLLRSFTICAAVACFFIFGFPAWPVSAAVINHYNPVNIGADTVWNASDVHILTGAYCGLNIGYGATLTLEPGAVVKLDKNCAIYVVGKFLARGTSEKPIAITSVKDDKYGGDTNGDGAATVPAPGDWYAIQVPVPHNAAEQVDGEVVFDYAVISYGGRIQDQDFMTIGVGQSSNFSITNSELLNNINPISFSPQAENFSMTHSNIYAPDYCKPMDDPETGVSGTICGGWIWSQSPTWFDVSNNYWGSVEGPTVQTAEGGIKLAGVMLAGNLNYEPFSAVKFDLFKPAVVKQHPVIVIPGILGSWQDWQGVWQMDPILHSYDDLLDALRAAGYKDGESLFPFPYQWRQSNVITARELKVKIATVKAACVASDTMDCSKVDLVAHSMGGLVARQYIESIDYADDVDQLIFIATPHKGAPKAYLMWEGGETESKPDDRPLNILLSLEAFKNGYYGTGAISKYIKGENIDSVKELLPVYHYLFDQSVNNSSLRYYPNNYPVNTFLENLNSMSNMEKLADIKMTNIIGDFGNGNTLNSLYLVSSTKSGLWENGMPKDYYINPMQGLIYGPGDGTVPALSNSNFLDLESIKIINQDHTHVVAYSQNEVIKELTGKELQNEIHNMHIPDILIIVMHSPADFMITAPDGKKIGRDLNQPVQSVINEIPNAFYSGFGLATSSEFIVIPNPQSGEYKISALGTDEGGRYSVTADYITETTSTTAVYSGAILPNQQQSLSLEFSSSTAMTQEIAANITIKTTISDVSLIYGKQLLIGSANKQKLLSKYETIKAKVAISDGLLKLAQSAKDAVLRNAKLSSVMKNRMLAMANEAIMKITRERSALIVKGLNEINIYLNDLKTKNILLQLGYDILKADNDYLTNNW